MSPPKTADQRPQESWSWRKLPHKTSSLSNKTSHQCSQKLVAWDLSPGAFCLACASDQQNHGQQQSRLHVCQMQQSKLPTSKKTLRTKEALATTPQHHQELLKISAHRWDWNWCKKLSATSARIHEENIKSTLSIAQMQSSSESNPHCLLSRTNAVGAMLTDTQRLTIGELESAWLTDQAGACKTENTRSKPNAAACAEMMALDCWKKMFPQWHAQVENQNSKLQQMDQSEESTCNSPAACSCKIKEERCQRCINWNGQLLFAHSCMHMPKKQLLLSCAMHGAICLSATALFACHRHVQTPAKRTLGLRFSQTQSSETHVPSIDHKREACDACCMKMKDVQQKSWQQTGRDHGKWWFFSTCRLINVIWKQNECCNLIDQFLDITGMLLTIDFLMENPTGTFWRFMAGWKLDAHKSSKMLAKLRRTDYKASLPFFLKGWCSA